MKGLIDYVKGLNFKEEFMLRFELTLFCRLECNIWLPTYRLLKVNADDSIEGLINDPCLRSWLMKDFAGDKWLFWVDVE